MRSRFAVLLMDGQRCPVNLIQNWGDLLRYTVIHLDNNDIGVLKFDQIQEMEVKPTPAEIVLYAK